MDRASNKTEEPAVQVLGFHVEGSNFAAAGTSCESEGHARMTNSSSVPYLPPTVSDAPPLPSPSNAFLVDAVNASGLGNTPNAQSSLRPAHSQSAEGFLDGDVQELATIAEGDSQRPVDSGTHSVVAPPASSAFASVGQHPPNLHLPRAALPVTAERAHSGTALTPADAGERGAAPSVNAARTFSKSGTPRSAVDAPAGLEQESSATVLPITPGPRGGSAGAGTSSGTKKKKASEMSKAERRAMQEEQRAQKAALKENQEGKAKAKSAKGKPALPEAERPAVHKKHSEAPMRTSGLTSLDMFSHLPPHLRMTAQAAVKKSDKLHPAILELGLAYSDGTIVGSSARSIAMMLAMRCVVRDYKPLENQAFNRALTSHINACVGFLWDECRPACASQRNSIKWLKSTIHHVSSAEEDDVVRQRILKTMDNFVNEKFTFAEKMIVQYACSKIDPGDTIVTYGHSTVVESILISAKEEGKDFSVMCVDARPEHSGESLCANLLDHGIKCSYMALNALPHMIKSATKVMLGASAVKSNGAVVARSGSALVAMAACNARKPVLICTQSIKFHDEVQLESITSNEQGDPKSMLTVRHRPELSAKLSAISDSGKLSVLNLVYDVMPIEFITLIVTEFGLIPPTSVPVILREKRDAEAMFAKE